MPFLSSMGGAFGYGRGPGPVSVSSPFGVYVIGDYGSNPLNIYDANGTTFSGTLAQIGGTDCFIVKYDLNGTEQWRTRIGGSTTDNSSNIAIDSSGNSYVVGTYLSSPLNIYDANGTTCSGTLINTNASNNDVFIVKYNTNGQQVWRTRIGGNLLDGAGGITTDGSGNVYVCGFYRSNPLNIYDANGDISSGTLQRLGLDADTDAFIVKYDTNGIQLWRTRLSGTNSDNATSIKTDISGNVYVCGTYRANPLNIYDANGTVSSATLTPVTGTVQTGFIVKYNTDGVLQWQTRIGGNNTDTCNNIAIDNSGNVYVCGSYQSSTTNIYDANGTVSSGTLLNTGSTGTNDAFVVKYDTNGIQQWRTRIGGINSDLGRGITVGSSGNVYVCGNYNTDPLNIYDANGTTISGTLINTNVSNNDAFLVKYNANGIQIWRTRIGGAGNDGASNLSIDSSENVYVTGIFASNPLNIYDANGTASSGTLANIGSNDEYIVKYNTNGQQVWRTRIGGTSTENATGIAVLS